jgi:two-component system response regulator DesR
VLRTSVGLTGPVDLVIATGHDFMRMLLHEFLELSLPDRVILRANSGRQLLELSALHRPALVVADYQLPDFAGPELIARLRSATPNTRVILITSTSNEHRAAAFAAGARACVSEDLLAVALLPQVLQVLDEGIPNGSCGGKR